MLLANPAKSRVDSRAGERGGQFAPEKERPKIRSKPRRSSRTKRRGARIIALEKLTAEFAGTLKANFRPWIKESPRAFKKRVQSLLGSQLPPYPQPGGRHRFPHITLAVNLYRDQLRQKREKAETKVIWVSIARECIRGFGKMPYYARTHRLNALRNAVYASGSGNEKRSDNVEPIIIQLHLLRVEARSPVRKQLGLWRSIKECLPTNAIRCL